MLPLYCPGFLPPMRSVNGGRFWFQCGVVVDGHTESFEVVLALASERSLCADCTAGRIRAIKMAMMPITTSTLISVNAHRGDVDGRNAIMIFSSASAEVRPSYSLREALPGAFVGVVPATVNTISRVRRHRRTSAARSRTRPGA